MRNTRGSLSLPVLEPVLARGKCPVLEIGLPGLTLCTFRFAEIEILAVLTLLVMRYEIQVMDEPKFASETLEERRARIVDAERTTTGLMRARRVPLTFKRR